MELIITNVLTIVILSIFHHLCSGEEYCQHDKFSPRCGDDSVIVMTSAVYGLKKSGRCIQRDYGYVGCSSDVTAAADARCSGRRACDITIPDETFGKLTNCPKDLVQYLDASYTCFKVETPSQQGCYSDQDTRLTSRQGYLASVVAEQTSCGSTARPWLIAAKRGQRVNITLYDFGVGKYSSVNEAAPSNPQLKVHCIVYANVKEIETKRSFQICAGEERVHTVYTSSQSAVATNPAVEVRILPGYAGRLRHFMLFYEVFGCALPELGEEVIVDIEGDRGMVSCRHSQRSWPIRCEESNWAGLENVNNCSEALHVSDSAVLLNKMFLPQPMSILILLAIALAMGGSILITGLVCFRRRRRRALLIAHPGISAGGDYEIGKASAAAYYKTQLTPLRPLTYGSAGSVGGLVDDRFVGREVENEYEYVDDVILRNARNVGHVATDDVIDDIYETTSNRRLRENVAHDYVAQDNQRVGRGGSELGQGQWVVQGRRVQLQCYECSALPIAAMTSSPPHYYELDPNMTSSRSHACSGVAKQQNSYIEAPSAATTSPKISSSVSLSNSSCKVPSCSKK